MTVPGASGDFGILPGHEPTVAMLRPGVMTVTSTEGNEQKLFVSSGYAFVHANSTADICALETTKLEDLDKDAINEVTHYFHKKKKKRGGGGGGGGSIRAYCAW